MGRAIPRPSAFPARALIVMALLVSLAMLLALFRPDGVRADTLAFSTAPLVIHAQDGRTHNFTVELALDEDQRAQGLMFRRAMAPEHGMLFDFGEVRRVMMWMKNTTLPLDMLFIGRNGRVETIRENAVPQSEAIIDSGKPVAFVLELNAGTVSRLGLKPGDRVETARIR
ncbi:hypothetical protein BJF92_21880 [Rhizobium rhizosphaerae]|uniref:DUF192 domain-containing protein n=2 Tax=Xaviernesmea rhizosphaerae TaxID=1672749 RepID=A0A1Q9AJQ0_9HYPH|nr:hypothetical protein BJF92_21880 [Xaviernesmea rhizosphaerae]OQP88445.1 hypothetical protein BTR14_00900 [Xaviernesmea rhizosphaerae]